MYRNGLPHRNLSLKPGSNLGGCDPARQIAPEGHTIPSLLSLGKHGPQRQILNLRIPEGVNIGAVPLEACKSYPIKVFEGLGIPPKIAYADLNTKKERNDLIVRWVPDGGKTAPHPQVCFFVRGKYHVENLVYNVSDPFEWATWIEFVLHSRDLKKLIDALIKIECKLEGIS